MPHWRMCTLPVLLESEEIKVDGGFTYILRPGPQIGKTAIFAGDWCSKLTDDLLVKLHGELYEKMLYQKWVNILFVLGEHLYVSLEIV